ncbi:AAA family ATPase [Streptomyces sp. WM6378]|uniref:AAA family ATPase n=1 Tax=Streptomyces sp. WM6378 TaxID=1415557 RepID=UPI0006AF8A8B|nr:AAA family ATPase [Streptomyces sp. WM6378]
MTSSKQTALARLQSLRAAIEARAMICIYGQAGRGKSLAVNTSLRELAPKLTRRIQFRGPSLDPRPAPRAVPRPRLAGTSARPRDRVRPLLRGALEETHVLVCDEAQWLSVSTVSQFGSVDDLVTVPV